VCLRRTIGPMYKGQIHEGLQNGDSPFINAGVGMVSQLPIDYMHLVCLGVAKRILLMWIKGSLDISINFHMCKRPRFPN
jgi:hypothetical protein